MVQRYEVMIDPYHQKPRLNLFKFDGSPIMPLYLAQSPPKMLPASTLNPLATATAKPAKVRRGEMPSPHDVLFKRTATGAYYADHWWWFGAFMTASGGVLYFFF